MTRRIIGLKPTSILTALMLGIAFGAWTAPAAAYVVQISAVAFVEHDSSPDIDGTAFGVLEDAHGAYFAAVNFPVNGHHVCRFSMVYGDNEPSADLTARLYRRVANIGGEVSDQIFLMARVSSTGAQPQVRRATTRSISSNTVSINDSFYFVHLEILAKTLDPIGVQIDVRPTC